MLAQLLTLRDYETYFALTQGYKILDNGAAEGEQVSTADLVALARDYNFDEVVVPDAMGDVDETIRRARQFENYADSRHEYMGVVQGRTVPEVIKCATALSFLDYITVLGVPRHLTYIHRDLRVNFGEALHNMYDRDLPLHFLGTGQDPKEVVRLATLDTARSHDTSMPFVATYNKHRLATYRYDGRPDDYFNIRGLDEELLHDNIRTYLDWAGEQPIT